MEMGNNNHKMYRVYVQYYIWICTYIKYQHQQQAKIFTVNLWTYTSFVDIKNFKVQ